MRGTAFGCDLRVSTNGTLGESTGLAEKTPGSFLEIFNPENLPFGAELDCRANFSDPIDFFDDEDAFVVAWATVSSRL